MSRIGNAPIELKSGVSVALNDHHVTVKGPRGELSREYDPRLTIRQDDGSLIVSRGSEAKQDKALHGLTRTLVANMVQGVTEGYEKRLELHSSQGDVYRVQKQGEQIVLQLGFSHTVEVRPKPGVKFEVEIPPRTGAGQVTGILVISGNDKEEVGQQAAEIRLLRPPEPYKGKGIRYKGEYVRRKAGKAGKAGGKGAKGKK
ncbi:MAG TPA: 50S ribosomal protein L6 [Armatimonadota bacterium]|nr:50S ribosomal protein L6 [Armatimonadota bacterium]